MSKGAKASEARSKPLGARFRGDDAESIHYNPAPTANQTDKPDLPA